MMDGRVFVFSTCALTAAGMGAFEARLVAVGGACCMRRAPGMHTVPLGIYIAYAGADCCADELFGIVQLGEAYRAGDVGALLGMHADTVVLAFHGSWEEGITDLNNEATTMFMEEQLSDVDDGGDAVELFFGPA